jgi:hypothetical protein
LFLIQKNDRTCGKPIPLSGGDGRGGICASKSGCVLALELSVQTAVEQNQKTEPRGARYSALSGPWIIV